MRSSHLRLVWLALAASCFGDGVCSAVTIQVETVGIPFSTFAQTGAFEVFITGDLVGQPAIAAHQVRVSVAAPASGITFDAAGVTTNRSYLGPSAAPVISLSTLEVDSGDFTLSGGASLFDEAGLLRVNFALLASLPVGFYGVLLEPSPQFTFLIDENSLDLDLTIANGAIRVLLPGDYDWDDDVDGADFLKWQRSLGSTEDLLADGNRNGVVDAADLAIWQDNLGSRSLATSAAVTVPEPATLFQSFTGLFILCMGGQFVRWRPWKRRSRRRGAPCLRWLRLPANLRRRNDERAVDRLLFEADDGG